MNTLQFEKPHSIYLTSILKKIELGDEDKGLVTDLLQFMANITHKKGLILLPFFSDFDKQRKGSGE